MRFAFAPHHSAKKQSSLARMLEAVTAGDYENQSRWIGKLDEN